MKLHKSDTYQHMSSIRKIQSVNETWVTMTTSLAALHGIGLAGISNVPQPHLVMQHPAMQKQEPPKSFNLLWSLRPSLLALQIRWMWSRCTVDTVDFYFSLSLSLFVRCVFVIRIFSEVAFDLQQKVLQHPEVRMQLAGVAQLTTCNAHTVLAAGRKLWEQEGLQGLYRGRELWPEWKILKIHALEVHPDILARVFSMHIAWAHKVQTSQLQECWWFTSRFAAIGFTRAFLQRCSYGPLWAHSGASCGFSRPGIGSDDLCDCCGYSRTVPFFIGSSCCILSDTVFNRPFYY